MRLVIIENVVKTTVVGVFQLYIILKNVEF
jgi:hypothetical protein